MDVVIVFVGSVIAFLLVSVGFLVWVINGWALLGILCISAAVIFSACCLAIARWAAKGDLNE